MILLFGGTADTVPLANLIVSSGRRVLISTLTDHLDFSSLDPRAQRRHGPLRLDDLEEFIGAYKFTHIIDATHPYAQVVQSNIQELAQKLQLPLIRFERAESSFDGYNVIYVSDHEEAAKLISKNDWRAFLTIGSRNLKHYSSHKAVARILDQEASLEEALASGFQRNNLISRRGPFTLEENIEHLKKTQAQVLVTKDGGEAGHVLEKLMATKALGLPTIVIKRPERERSGLWVTSYEELMQKLGELP